MAGCQDAGSPVGMKEEAGRSTLKISGCWCVPTRGQSVQMLRVWFCLTVPMNSLQTIPFSRKSIATRQQARRLLPVPCGKAPDGCYETHFGQKIAGFFGFWGDNKARKKDV